MHTPCLCQGLQHRSGVHTECNALMPRGWACVAAILTFAKLLSCCAEAMLSCCTEAVRTMAGAGIATSFSSWREGCLQREDDETSGTDTQ